MDIVWAILIVVLALACWASNVLGLPGNWMVVGLAAIFALMVPSESRIDLGWPLILLLLLLAGIGEFLEFATAAFTTTKEGGSKRGALLALIGSVIGGIIGMIVGAPFVLVVGSVVGALLGSGLGALVGALIGELWKGHDFDKSMKIGRAAFWGRLIGTAAKILFGAAMIVVIIAGLVWK